MSHSRSPRRGNAGRRVSRQLFKSASLDEMARNALAKSVRIVARCGASSSAILETIKDAVAEIPPDWRLRGLRATPEIGNASHILTVWHTNTRYVTASGKPRSLALQGSRGSFSDLVEMVDSSLNPKAVLAYLIKLNAVRRVGIRFIPRERSLMVGGNDGPDHFRALRVLHGATRTLDHNLENGGESWFEYIAENSHFPVSQRDVLDSEVRRQGDTVLSSLDNFMHTKEMERQPGEPVMKVAIGFKFWEGAPDKGSKTGRRKRKRARRG